MIQTLSVPTQEILDAYDNTSEHSIAERKALAAALRMLINQHKEYADDGCGPFIVYCCDIWSVIDELEKPCEEEQFLSFIDRCIEDDPSLVVPADEEQLERLAKVLGIARQGIEQYSDALKGLK